MFKKTAIALSLAMVAGTGFAQTDTSTDTGASASVNAGGTNAGISTSTTASAMFKKLDVNGDGVLSATEAKANSQVADLYESMDTNASIKTDPTAGKGDGNVEGVTLDQFKAGIQAAAAGSAGPAVSGGGIYTLMRDGTMKKTGEAKSKLQGAMGGAADTGATGSMSSKMQDSKSMMSDQMQDKKSRMSDKMHSTSTNVSNKMSDMKGHMKASGDSMRSTADAKAKMTGNQMSTGATNAYDNGMKRANKTVDGAANTATGASVGANASMQTGASANTNDDNQ